MRTKLGFLIGAGAGYVLGARAGRERYDQIVTQARQWWESPQVQQAAGDLQEKATEVARSGGSALQEKVGGGQQSRPADDEIAVEVVDIVEVDLTADTDLVNDPELAQDVSGAFPPAGSNGRPA